ncbi:hypothetical protein BH10CYA1_BH10CYA1_62840 [soil metagenome]
MPVVTNPHVNSADDDWCRLQLRATLLTRRQSRHYSQVGRLYKTMSRIITEIFGVRLHKELL